MRTSIQQVYVKENDGLWMASCYDHTDNLKLARKVTVGGYRFKDLVSDWFFERENP